MPLNTIEKGKFVLRTYREVGGLKFVIFSNFDHVDHFSPVSSFHFVQVHFDNLFIKLFEGKNETPETIHLNWSINLRIVGK